VADEIQAAMWYLQIVVTVAPEDLGGTTNADLRRFFIDRVMPAIGDDKRVVLEELMNTVTRHWRDPVALDEAADWVASRFVHTEDPPASPTGACDLDNTS